MLVLSRKRDQSLILDCPDGTTIEVKVTGIEPHRVRLGISAPTEVGIVRKEIDRTVRVVTGGQGDANGAGKELSIEGGEAGGKGDLPAGVAPAVADGSAPPVHRGQA
jgi:carbon storage regulator CsrA